MRSPAKCAAWLLPFILSGCIAHKAKPVAVQPLAPAIQPTIPVGLAVLELPPSVMVIPAKQIYNMKEQAVPIKQPLKKRKPANKPDDTEAAANVTPALGELSSGDPANFRQQTEDSIAGVERGLSSINRPLDDSEEKTADHIREFIKQARTALASGDIDGAHTLTEKAKVLLAELSK
jgi:hypothetical protein